jgi:hypothetical protein
VIPFARTLLAVALAVLLIPASSASAAPPTPRDLEVDGGDGWRSDFHFELRWRNPANAGSPLAAVHYLVRDEAGAPVVGPKRLDWPAQQVGVGVPGGPGVYGFEVWLEDGTGAQGEPATTSLRFDDTRPAGVSPLAPNGWIGRAQLPHPVRVSHPGGPPPPAGIRGYAISVDRDPEGEPCTAEERCTEAETDLRGGSSEDRLELDLPEGLSYLHAVAVSGSGMRSAAVGSTAVRVDRADPITRLTGVPEGWTDHPVILRATASDAASGMRPDGPNGPFTAIGIDGGPPSISAGASTGATVIRSGVHTIAFYARDAAGNVDDGATANGRPNAPPLIAWVRIDLEPPAVAFLPSTHPDDPELIEARVTDALSGPDAEGNRIGVRRVGSGGRFEPLPTVFVGGLLRARWNSDDYRAGDYEFQAVGYDKAGNLATTTTRANGSPMVLPSPLKTRAELSAGLGGDAALAHRVPCGRGVTYRGRLALASGSPLARMPVRIVERFDPGGGLPERITTTVTGADGRFAVRLSPGPSREVLAGFTGTRTRTRASSRAARLEVRSGIHLRASSPLAVVGGRPVVFRGRVAGGEEIPAGGLSVQLQFRLPGVPWTEFRTVRTDGRGRFHYPYRFSDDDSRGVRFLFRAYAPAQGEWPYEPGGSLPVAVRGG